MLPLPASRDIDREARLRASPQVPPSQPPGARILNFDEVALPWTPEMVRREAARCLHCDGAPCVSSCPLGTDIPTALWLTEHGDFIGAAEVLQSTNNLPEICSRVCPQSEYCQRGCPHAEHGNPPVAIGPIEGFLADRFRKETGWSLQRPPCTGRRVAVVGSGPAGLTVGEILAREGHCITIFEQWPHGGGLLRYGIPRFKLDHALVQRRLDYLHGLGVEFVYDMRIGDDKGVDALFAEGFHAVFLGTGASRSVQPSLPGADLRGVYQARPFLVQANVEQNLRPSELEDPPEIGQRVAVVGGGDTAMDCCRTALRMGAEEVTCYYRRSEHEMPGNPVDRRLAREEGVAFEWLASPVEMVGDGRGRVKTLRLVRTVLGRPDSSGRPRPEPLPGTEFEARVDSVILALGFVPDGRFPGEALCLSTDASGLVRVDSRTGRTTREMVWAGGDNVRGPSLVAHAVAQARTAARDMHRRLSW